jgi:hypothetical protein
MEMLKLRENKHGANINCGEMAETEVGDVQRGLEAAASAVVFHHGP